MSNSFKFFCLFSVFCLCSCLNSKKIVLKVEEQTWSLQEVQSYMEVRLFAPFEENLQGENLQNLKQKLLKEILFMALLEDWSQTQKLSPKKILLTKAEQKLFEKDPDKLKAFQKFQSFLFLKEKLLEFLEKQIPDPPLKEQKNYYQKHKKQFLEPAQCLLDQIVLKEEALAQSLSKRLKQGESFSQLAKRYSKGQKSLGWLEQSEFPFFDRVCLDSSPHKPIKSAFAYHLFLKKGFKKARQKSFLESQKRLIKILKSQKRALEFQKWLKQQSQKKNVWIDKKALEKIRIQYK